jgi:hypothetical protein
MSWRLLDSIPQRAFTAVATQNVWIRRTIIWMSKTSTAAPPSARVSLVSAIFGSIFPVSTLARKT